MINFLRKFLYHFPGIISAYHFVLAFLGAVIYRFPSRKIFVIGVTGTKGKTTTLELINAILEAAGKKTALASSLRMKVGDKSTRNSSGNTMPGRFFLERFLRQAVGAGCDYALVEVTSQGVVASRHRFIGWRVGALTNLAPEHIESHGSFENYRRAKLNFLKYVVRKGGSVFLNKDDSSAGFFAESLNRGRATLYSKNDIFALPISEFLENDFNRENAALAVVVARKVGIDESAIESALKNFFGLAGRMEFVQREPFAVIVDYAHTPDSLRRVYQALRNANPKKLVCVLGSAGGGRDKWKRPEMGKAAAEHCDEIILANEDPYEENPVAILDEIESGFLEAKGGKWRAEENYWRILDRREAIKKAISLARKGDIVVLTGKGSENSIHEKGGRKVPWDERFEAEKALNSENSL